MDKGGQNGVREAGRNQFMLAPHLVLIQAMSLLGHTSSAFGLPGNTHSSHLEKMSMRKKMTGSFHGLY